MSSRTRAVRLPESVEHVRQKIRINSLSVILDRDRDLAIRLFNDDFDVAAFGSEFQCIYQEIPDYLLNALRIACYLDIVRTKICRKVDGFGSRLGPNDLDRCIYHGSDRRRNEV